MPVNFSAMKYVPMLILLMLLGCSRDAPRNNPFDPKSDVYDYAASVRGTVHRKIPPYSGIPDVKVRMLNGTHETLTNDDGEYVLEHLPKGSVTLSVSKAGYGTEQIITATNSNPEDIYLNARPTIDSVRVITTHRSHWWPVEDEYTITINAHIDDPDGVGDLDSVWFQFQIQHIDIPVSGALPADGEVQAELFDWQLDDPVTNLIGDPLNCFARDVDALVSKPVEMYITRFIEPTPVPLSPVDNTEVSSKPTLRWDYFDASFTFFYSVDVFRITSGNTSVLMYSRDAIPQSTAEHTVSDSLPPGSYYWTLGVTDILGNSSHSKEATFTVPQ